MAVERFYSGDPLSASRFNRLVATVCNLRRKVAEIKRRPKANLLRNERFARYPYSATCGCGCGWIGNFCARVCVGQFPIYKPPFSMHWKTSEWECNGKRYSTETTTLKINHGFWFRGSSIVEIPSQQIDNAPSGCYYVLRCTMEFVRGSTGETGLLPCNVWLVGKVADGEITDSWSGDIYQEPLPCKQGLVAITDYARFVANEIDPVCGSAYGSNKHCRFTPSRALWRAEYNNPPAYCGGAYMLFSGCGSNRNYRWATGDADVSCGKVPFLCVNIHGRQNDGTYYDGQTVFVCKASRCGYTYQCVLIASLGVVVGYARRDTYRCIAYSCIWVDAPVVPQQNAIAFWGVDKQDCYQGCGFEITTCWNRAGEFTQLQTGYTETESVSEYANWKTKNYIADVVLCEKEPVDAVYSVPKKQSVSETYYTGENCNGN